MKVVLLGTGTSQGVPVIGCNCETCVSSNKKDKRLRTSAYIESGGKKILIDTSVDFRQQMLHNRIDNIDAVLYTHHHVDHIFGLDDLRQYTQRHNKYIDLYAGRATLKELKITFRYVLDEELIRHKSVPLVHFNEIQNSPFRVGDVSVMPVKVSHGNIKIFGFRIKDFAYITDSSAISDAELKKLQGLKVLVLNALRIRPHPTHFSLQEAVEIALMLKPERTYLTHVTHDLLHDRINAALPKGIELAYDNLKIRL